MIYAISAALLVSVCLNIYLIQFKMKSKRKDSYELQEFLHDLTSPGIGMIKIERIAPTDVFLRSPRDS